MATKKSQRWGILVILVALVIGTFGSFAAMMIGNDTQTQEAARQQALYAKYQEESKAYQAKLDAQGVELSKKYYEDFKQYSSQVGEFDRDSVKELKTEDLKVGDGAEITGTTKFATYYIGWNPKGKVFDQSIDGEALKSPLPVADGLDAAGLITGWKDGMKGMKIGGVRVVTIPSDLAYGEQSPGDDIPANTPLKFVIMAIPLPEQFAPPSIPNELMQAS